MTLERGAGAGKRLHLDAFSGVAGDMFVAALLDLGVPVAPIEAAIASVGLEVELRHEYVARSSIRARRFEVIAPDEAHERTHRAIAAMLEPLEEGVRRRARAAFLRLAEAEAQVHGVSVDDVHFHEVGAVDSIVDVVAASAALEYLGAELSCSPLPMGRGAVKTRHGLLPLPAPATLLCLAGAPTYDGGVAMELVTPTGACLVATNASRFERWPAMRPERVGWGAGTRDLQDRPNALRVVLGEVAHTSRELVLVETNVDDASPEALAYALERAREAGARDAWSAPVGMKKGRAGVRLSVLVEPSSADAIVDVLLRETPTLGVRLSNVERRERPRRIVRVATRFGEIPVKIADGDGRPRRAKPEHDACAEAARAHGVSLNEVERAALAAIEDAT